MLCFVFSHSRSAAYFVDLYCVLVGLRHKFQNDSLNLSFLKPRSKFLFQKNRVVDAIAALRLQFELMQEKIFASLPSYVGYRSRCMFE